MSKVFLKGLTTGLLLQIAVGPVFFYIVNLVMQTNFLNGLFAVFAVTIVDYIYITLAILGVGKIMEKEKIKLTFGLLSSLVLIIFGIILIKGIVNINGDNIVHVEKLQNIYNSFISAFVLTISSPLTIIFWTSIFATKSIEYSFTKKELLVFGLSAGLATLLFLGSSILVLSIIKSNIPLIIVKALNILVGLILIIYGMVRIYHTYINSHSYSKT